MQVLVEVNDREVLVEVSRRADGRLQVAFEGKSVDVTAERLPEGGLSLLVDGESLTAFLHGDTLYLSGYQYDIRADDPLKKELLRTSGFERHAGSVTAAMPGNVKKILKSVGDEVAAGEGVLVLEAMKMENELEAPKDGVIREIYVTEGQSVEAGAPLFDID